MRISDGSSDLCSSDLGTSGAGQIAGQTRYLILAVPCPAGQTQRIPWTVPRELRPDRRRREASRHPSPPSLLLVVQLARNELPCFRGWARLHLYARSDRPAPASRRLHRTRDARRARDDEQEVVMAGFERSNRPLRDSPLARPRALFAERNSVG